MASIIHMAVPGQIWCEIDHVFFIQLYPQSSGSSFLNSNFKDIAVGKKTKTFLLTVYIQEKETIFLIITYIGMHNYGNSISKRHQKQK